MARDLGVEGAGVRMSLIIYVKAGNTNLPSQVGDSLVSRGAANKSDNSNTDGAVD